MKSISSSITDKLFPVRSDSEQGHQDLVTIIWKRWQMQVPVSQITPQASLL